MSARTILDAFRDLFFKKIDEENKAQRRKRIVPPCPECKAKCVVRCYPGYRCNQCGIQWSDVPAEIINKPMTRSKWLEENPQKEHGK